jgi:hypothetical protein
MTQHKISHWVLRLLGTLLLTAAMLKGYELLALPTANKDLWSYRPFLILQVELELILGLWLLSGLWKRLAWWISLLCFGLFCSITLYKAMTGADSCGCFGLIHVNPWMTLWAIDVPAVLLLALFRPQKRTTVQMQPPVCQRGYVFSMSMLLLALVSVTAAGLIQYEPQKVTATFEVLEPQTWTGQTLPILEHVDVADKLKQGNWLIMLFHHDCPDCAEALPQFQEIADNFVGNEEVLQLALIEIPPYGYQAMPQASTYLLGHLDESKKWMVVTPAVLLATEGMVQQAWEQGTMPTFDTVLEHIAQLME